MRRDGMMPLGGSVLITGGTGFLGHGLVDTFLEEDHAIGRICVYSRGEFAQARMRAKFEDERMRFFIGDVRDIDRLERAMQGCTYVIHAAALKRIEVGHYNPDEMVKTNVIGTMNVIEAARRARVRRVVFVSSDKAFQPVSPYGLSKALAENLVLAANAMALGPTFTVCRYGNVAGSTGSVIPTWREILKATGRVPVTDPDCTRFWMTRAQAVQIVISAMHCDVQPGDGPIIPKLSAYRLGDLATVMGAKGMDVRGLSRWEKKHEAMADGNSSDSARRLPLVELGMAYADAIHDIEVTA